MPDEELIEQCRQLYAKHREALELIYRYGEVNVFQAAATSFLNDHSSEITWSEIRPNRAAFIPNQLFHVMPEMAGLNWFGQSRPLLIWFFMEGNKLGIVIEVGPYSDEKFPRDPLVQILLDHFGSKAKIYPKYTRVYTKNVRLNDDQVGDGEKLRDDMEKLYKDASQHLSAIQGILSAYFGHIETLDVSSS